MRLEHDQHEHNIKGRASTNGSSQNGSSPHTNGSTNGVHGNGVGPSAIKTPFYGHDREEVTRILLQSLSDLGYQDAAQLLSRESGYQLEIPSVAAFRNAVQAGQWDEAEALLFGTAEAGEVDGGVSLGNGHSPSAARRKSRRSVGSANGHTQNGLPLVDGADVVPMKFLLRQQKYLELLEQRQIGAALTVLQKELTPLTAKRDIGRLHALSAFIMCPSAEDLRIQADWDGAQGQSRSMLLSDISKSISPSVMIPEHRLATLFTSVQQQQILDCQYHNTTAQPSLYLDHSCSADDFPLQTLTELRDHSDEVWFLEFSHDGSLLATAGKDGLVTVYDTNQWKVMHEFREHERNAPAADARGVCYVAFSPDDQYLITCSQNNEFAVMSVRHGHLVAKGDHFDYPVTAAAWLPDSQHFVIGTQSSRRPLGLYSMRSSIPGQVISNNEVHSWRDPPWDINQDRNGGGANSFRVTDVAVSQDGSRMAATTIDNRILVYDLHSRDRIAEWPMLEKLTSITWSEDGELLLINMNEGKVFTINAVSGEVAMRYDGARQAEFVIRSRFGGADENFVISGSEDSKVYIWRRQTGDQVAALDAHSPGTVNAVAWHPTNPAVFASAGDDRRVRIWTSANAMRSHAAEAGAHRSLSGGPYGFNR